MLTFPWCIYFFKAPFSSPLSGALRFKSPALQTFIKETQTQINLKEPMIEVTWDCFHRSGTCYAFHNFPHSNRWQAFWNVPHLLYCSKQGPGMGIHDGWLDWTWNQLRDTPLGGPGWACEGVPRKGWLSGENPPSEQEVLFGSSLM